MKRIYFQNTKSDFSNNQTDWYLDKHFNDYMYNEQAENLPKLKGFSCFVVKGKSDQGEQIEDYVLIDNKQNVIQAYPYTLEGFGQMEAYINIIKISKHYDQHEKNNI